ncbi:hypothetical protein H257_00529 [Aphanomyces astaci]|uniref:Uncharacterized protein n=1 Tax=Aphanomyces astaci TaxID=112090 RepID=W4HC53_APHAT|nr:hypothetical protein H257_00529 [Aphanomyces astaci]ETV89161.1 hypothetical protein H257_00529 [Aphanomyces astaci]RHX98020.1 hypothetical protein DYB36_009193 [Aphanomyces astaci]RQM30496.1 hypothetical protein B5M09_001631 [Aphanomyces astaci]|eukprot:XP_009821561.1 hypothetical protein H257_00529 [Aphanomyces astaci]
MPPHETTSVDFEACLPVCDRLTLPPHHKAPHHHHNRKRRKQRHHHHHHIKSLFYTLVAVVVACVLLLFSMMQRMTLDATLHDLMNAFVNADFIPHAVSKGIVELRIPESRAVQPIDIERQLLGTLFTQLVSRKRKLMMEIVKGAHVVVENDQGRFYELFRTISTSTYSRISSHFSNDVQYGVPQGYLLDTLLTGTTSGNDSWFQFEGANWDPIGRPVDSFIHCLNYIEYKIRGVQVGPLGTSMYTDQNPLRIPFDNSTETASRPDAMYRP